MIVKVNFLGKEYDIKCKEDEVAKIKNLELRLNNRVRQFSKKNQNFTDTHKLLIATLSLEDQVNDLLHSKKILQSNLDDLEKERKILLDNHSIDYEDTYTGSFTERRAIIYTFSFVAKAYVYGPVTTSKPITKAEATIYADLQDKAPPRVAKVTQQAIGTPDEDDNFGFNETISEWT